MKKINEIREAYDENYEKMLNVIKRMGGDGQIKFHRKNKTPLYKTLKSLQKEEHSLSEMEANIKALQEDFA